MSRSLAVYKDMCLSQGIEFSEDKESVTVFGKLRPGKYSVRGDVSSQFISGLMFALPLLENDSIIDIKRLVPRYDGKGACRFRYKNKQNR